MPTVCQSGKKDLLGVRDDREGPFLFQRVSVLVQRYNAVLLAYMTPCQPLTARTDDARTMHNNRLTQTLFTSRCVGETQRCVVVSYNLHGSNQGFSGIKDLVNVLSPAVIMVQEHWLYPSNLFKLDKVASGYISFGSSAMNDKVGLGTFYGRHMVVLQFSRNVNLPPLCRMSLVTKDLLSLSCLIG